MGSQGGGRTIGADDESAIRMRKTVSVTELREELGRWLDGGSIDGMRRARLVLAVAEASRNPSASENQLASILTNYDPKTRGQLNDRTLAVFLDTMSKPNAENFVGRVLNSLPSQEENFGPQFTERGLRARFTRSFNELQAFACASRPPVSLAGERPQEAMPEWEERVRRDYKLMAETYEARRSTALDSQWMLQYRMLRSASMMCGMDFTQTSKGYVSEDSWVDFCEARMGFGLTDPDLNAPDIRKFLKRESEGNHLEAVLAGQGLSLRDDLKQNLVVARNYSDSIRGLDAYLKDPAGFPQNMGRFIR
ncbi:MAG: hypothetical protein ABIH11_02550 [Candidatus Altiarchaeota archaeon]